MRLVSYNIQYCTGKDGTVDVGRVVAEVENADIIAMQEVDRFWSRSGMTDQVEEITRRLPDHHWVYGPGIDLNASIRDRAGRLQNITTRTAPRMNTTAKVITCRAEKLHLLYPNYCDADFYHLSEVAL